jgi:hypothetical protein
VFILKVLEAIDEVGYLTNIRYSKINKHYSLKQVRSMEIENNFENKNLKSLLVKKNLKEISKIN